MGEGWREQDGLGKSGKEEGERKGVGEGKVMGRARRGMKQLNHSNSPVAACLSLGR